MLLEWSSPHRTRVWFHSWSLFTGHLCSHPQKRRLALQEIEEGAFHCEQGPGIGPVRRENDLSGVLGQ